MSTKLPTLSEVYEDRLEIAFKQDKFNALVNFQPKKEWIKQNPFAQNSNYIPIGIIETLLQKIFKQYKVEVLREYSMFNAVGVTIRLHFINPITNEWQFHDGVGAVQLQTKKGTSPAQLENINNNAVMMALPMAKSYAIKDAAEHLGRLFGRDLNRKDFLEFEADKSISDKVNEKERIRVIEWINNSTTIEQLKQVEQLANELELTEVYNNKLKQL